ncbi:hypothetical protein NRB20_48680 [Nocardia sp. RB20]|uniref:Uncharacterized protein n=2 Tax=Nocardia macrotermitis TaxID=2585198 RepID=A0A7K0D7L0_9NOCA|nr:hypothetical protein [Nocardia macrotermitis]
MRYGVTDLLDDLAGAQDVNERLAIAVTLWQATSHLLLTAAGHWSGGGKWLHREVAHFDELGGTTFASALADGMRAVALGEIRSMVDIVTAVLDRVGGRLFEGYRANGPG